MTDSENEKISFERSYKRLEEIARKLESPETALEESFQLFEEGQKLLQICHKLLDNAEKRLKVIQIGKTGVTIEETEID